MMGAKKSFTTSPRRGHRLVPALIHLQQDRQQEKEGQKRGKQNPERLSGRSFWLSVTLELSWVFM